MTFSFTEFFSEIRESLPHRHIGHNRFHIEEIFSALRLPTYVKPM